MIWKNYKRGVFFLSEIMETFKKYRFNKMLKKANPYLDIDKSVVTKNVPAWSVVAGNPEKVVKEIEH